jgi:hypothetical protein
MTWELTNKGGRKDEEADPTHTSTSHTPRTLVRKLNPNIYTKVRR